MVFRKDGELTLISSICKKSENEAHYSLGRLETAKLRKQKCRLGTFLRSTRTPRTRKGLADASSKGIIGAARRNNREDLRELRNRIMGKKKEA